MAVTPNQTPPRGADENFFCPVAWSILANFNHAIRQKTIETSTFWRYHRNVGILGARYTPVNFRETKSTLGRKGARDLVGFVGVEHLASEGPALRHRRIVDLRAFCVQ